MSKATDKQLKEDIINKYKQTENDSGSTHIQIALLTFRINYLVEHLKTHKKDNHSRRGLLNLVSQRKKLLSYLKSENQTEYLALAKDLKLKVTA